MLDDPPGGTQIVLSRTEREYGVDSAHHAESVEGAIEVAKSLESDVVYVLGGGMIYELFQPYLDRMVLSRVPGEYDGDSYYPDWEDNEWVLESETTYDGFRLEEWRRRDSEKQ